MIIARKGETTSKKLRRFSLVTVCFLLLTIILPLFKCLFKQERRRDVYAYLLSKNDKSRGLECSTRLMYITASGGINNQVLATVNALALAKYLNITAVVPTFTKLKTSKPLTFEPIPFSTYFDEEIFIDRALQLGVTVIPFAYMEKSRTFEIPASSGRSFLDIIRTMKEGLNSSKYCNIEILNQWGIRWPRSTPAIYEYLDVFEYRKDLILLAKSYKQNFLNFSYVAVHARVEDTSPNVYFSSDSEEGRKDEIAGLLRHLQKNSVHMPIYVSSGFDCNSELFQALRDVGYQLQCMDAFHPSFNSSGTESYVKSCVDSIIALGASHFVGRYASSASYIVKLRRSLLRKSTSMYCAKSGFMCSDCGLRCLSHRGIRRHYKSLRDMENCFFYPKCGLSRSTCIDMSFSNGSYDCRTRRNDVEGQSKQCIKLNTAINSQDGFKVWKKTCEKGVGTLSCNQLLNFNCA